MVYEYYDAEALLHKYNRDKSEWLNLVRMGYDAKWIYSYYGRIESAAENLGYEYLVSRMLEDTIPYTRLNEMELNEIILFSLYKAPTLEDKLRVYCRKVQNRVVSVPTKLHMLSFNAFASFMCFKITPVLYDAITYAYETDIKGCNATNVVEYKCHDIALKFIDSLILKLIRQCVRTDDTKSLNVLLDLFTASHNHYIVGLILKHAEEQNALEYLAVGNPHIRLLSQAQRSGIINMKIRTRIYLRYLQCIKSGLVYCRETCDSSVVMSLCECHKGNIIDLTPNDVLFLREYCVIRMAETGDKKYFSLFNYFTRIDLKAS